MTELKPCPFCGGSAKLVNKIYEYKYYIYCTRCGVMTANFDSNNSAIGAWNRRKNDDNKRSNVD